MEYYSAIKEMEFEYMLKWIDSENIMLSGKKKSPKVRYYMIPFLWNVQNM